MMNKDELEKIVSSVVRESLEKAEINEINLSLAKRLALKVELKAEEIGVKPVVAVANLGARPVLVECTDDSYIASYDIALNKAFTSVSLKMPTKQLKGLAQPGEPLYGIQFTNGGQIVVFGGGVPLVYGGRIIGGLGVSGGSEEQDTFLADYGAEILDEVIKTL